METPQPEEQKTEKKFELSPSISILIAGVLIAGSIVFVNLAPSQPVAAVGDPVIEPAVSAPTTTDHWTGSPSAPLVLVEYSDLQCPFCSMIHPTLKRIVAESNGEIAWVYRHLPLESIHPQALPAALASECVAEQLGDTGFWAFADTMFSDQTRMNDAYYGEVAQQLGANMEQFNACVESQKYLSKIQTQAREGEDNGGNGTPFTVLVKDVTQVPISGALPYAQIMAVINSVR